MFHLCADVNALLVIDKIITEVIKFHGMNYDRFFNTSKCFLEIGSQGGF